MNSFAGFDFDTDNKGYCWSARSFNKVKCSFVCRTNRRVWEL